MKDLGPIHTYEPPLMDRSFSVAETLKTQEVLRSCADCLAYVRPGPHICRVVPAVTYHPPVVTDREERRRVLDALAGCIGTNPPPQPGNEAVVPLALAYLQEKADRGEAKYGTKLETFNGRSALQDALEDSADTFLYLFQACLEEGLV